MLIPLKDKVFFFFFNRRWWKICSINGMYIYIYSSRVPGVSKDACFSNHSANPMCKLDTMEVAQFGYLETFYSMPSCKLRTEKEVTTYYPWP